MQIYFELTPRELESARKLFVKRTQSLMQRAQPWLNVASALFMSALYISLDLGFLVHSDRSPNPLDAPILAVWLTIAALGWYRRDKFAPEPDYRQKLYFEVEEDGIYRESDSTQSESRKKIHVPWTKISRYVESDEFFLLYSPWPWGMFEPKSSKVGIRQKGVLYILPKRVLDAGSISRLADLLQSKLSVWAKNPELNAETILSR